MKEFCYEPNSMRGNVLGKWRGVHGRLISGLEIGWKIPGHLRSGHLEGAGVVRTCVPLFQRNRRRLIPTGIKTVSRNRCGGT